MSKKISELTSAVSITGTEEVPIVQSGETKKATVDLLRPTIATSITSSSTNTEVAGAKAVYDKVNEASLCVGSIDTNKNLTITTAWSSGSKIIPLDSFTTNVGGDYTKSSDGGIIVGSAPKLIEIQAQLTPYTLPKPTSTNLSTQNTYQLVIKRKRNGTTTALAVQSQVINYYSVSALAFNVSVIVEAEENDIIYTSLGSDTASRSFDSGTAKNALTIKTLMK